jgi:hypothetical protein
MMDANAEYVLDFEAVCVDGGVGVGVGVVVEAVDEDEVDAFDLAEFVKNCGCVR